jgi:hypothetical protein
MAYFPNFGSLSRDAHLAEVVACTDWKQQMFVADCSHVSRLLLRTEELNYDLFKNDCFGKHNFRG